VGGDGPAARLDQREDAGEVALAALELDLVESLEERVRVEGVRAEIDLADGELILREALGVPGLEDAVDAAAGVADDAAVARRVEPVGCEERGEGAPSLVLSEQPLELLGGDERVIAGEDDDGAVPTAAPVPSPSRCSATSTPSGTPSATPSPGLTTATTRPAPASLAASTTHSTSVFPATR